MRKWIGTLKKWNPRNLPPARHNRCALNVEVLENRQLLSGGYLQTKLISDVPGLAQNTDPNLKNPWGIDYQPGGPFWKQAGHPVSAQGN